MDIDKNAPSYTEFLSKADSIFSNQKEVAVIDIDTKGTNPVINLIGSSELTLIKGQGEYSEPGIQIASSDHKQSIECKESNANDNNARLTCFVESKVDTNKIGKYLIKYTAFDHNPDDGKTYLQTSFRVVNVVENRLQVKLKGSNPMYLENGKEEFIDPGVDIFDATGKLLASPSTVSVDSSSIEIDTDGEYIVKYTAVADGYITGYAKRKVIVVNHQPPVIKLQGEEKITIEAGGVYSDPGVVATDNKGVDITDMVVVDNDIDLHKTGTYTVSYNVTDNIGNKANTVRRSIEVIDTTAPIITLSGDNPLK
jgi:hypothetical protein